MALACTEIPLLMTTGVLAASHAGLYAHSRQGRAAQGGRRPVKRHQLKFRSLPGSPMQSCAWHPMRQFPIGPRRETSRRSLAPPTNSPSCARRRIVPADVHSPQRWICLKLEGPFPFSQTGVLLSFIEPLSTTRHPRLRHFHLRHGLCSDPGGVRVGDRPATGSRSSTLAELKCRRTTSKT